jgi:plasmid maintenance system antidote protein VapI
MNVIDQNAFRKFLQSELAHRCDENPRYSLRAFARFLHVDYSTLSKILRGQVTVAEKLVGRLCDRLSAEPQSFLRVAPKLERSATRYVSAGVAKWYYFALLELTHTRGFRAEERWLAKRLGITVHQVREAAKQLVAMGMLEIDEAGRWHDCSGSATTSYRAGATSPALRGLQRQVLEIARAKLETVDIAHRDHSSIVLRFDRAQMEEARTFITNFRREFDRRFGSSENADSVYCLGLNLVPLTSQGERT